MEGTWATMGSGRICLRSLLKVAFFLHGLTIFDPWHNRAVSPECICQHNPSSTVYGSLYNLLQCKLLPKRCGHVVRARFTIKGYFGFRACRYPNNDSTFNLSRLVISGDISPNPGPSKKPCCQECFRTVAINHRSLVCATCGSNYHMKCGNVKPEEFDCIQENTLNWVCDQCTFKHILPFSSLSNTSFSSSVGLEELNTPNESCTDVKPSESHLGDLTSLDFSPKCLRTAHINICSLRNKLDELRVLQELCKFDIIGITESHLNSKDDNSELNIDGLKFIRIDRTVRKGGGCVLYYREDLRVIHRRDLNNSDIEAIWIEVKFPVNNTLFSVVYRPPDQQGFFNNFSAVLEAAWLKSNNIFLLGDFNCNMSTNGAALQLNSIKLKQIFESFNMQNVITRDTRVTPTSSTLIDLIVTTRKDLIRNSGSYPLGISDHNLVYAVAKLACKHPPPKYVKIRNYNKLNEKSFKRDMDNAPFHVATIFDDPDDSLWLWNKIFLQIANEHAPMKQVKVRSQSLPWITNGIRQKMNRRFKLYKEAVNTNDNEKWREYKHLRNKITAAVRRAKADFFKNKVNEVKTSSAYWRLVKDATNLSKCHKPVGPLERDDGSLAVCDVEKVNMMNAYFSSIGTKLAAQLPTSLPMSQIEVDDSTDIPTLAVIDIHEGTVKSKILNLKMNKATGPDEISPRLLKLLGETVVPPLASLFVSSFKTGVVPLEWKTAKLTTVYKKDDETDRGNYRPLSILSVLSKILESCVNDAIVDHVCNHRLVTDNQWAYRKDYSTQLLLVHLTEIWRHSIDTGYVVGVAFIDFKKAFDCVDHDILLNKLRRQFGIRSSLLHWMTSYLTSRRQYTVLNGQRSSLCSMSSGVPQGSVLGPTLFSLYTSDLVASIRTGSVYMYADDTTIYCIGETIDETAAALNQSLKELFAWCVKNRLTPHVKKSECMLISRGSFTGPLPPLYLGHNNLEWVTHSQLLGVVIDHKLDWSIHIKELKKRFANKLSLIKKSRFLPKQDLLHLYFKVIIPEVTYGITIWGVLTDNTTLIHLRDCAAE